MIMILQLINAYRKRKILTGICFCLLAWWRWQPDVAHGNRTLCCYHGNARLQLLCPPASTYTAHTVAMIRMIYYVLSFKQSSALVKMLRIQPKHWEEYCIPQCNVLHLNIPLPVWYNISIHFRHFSLLK